MVRQAAIPLFLGILHRDLGAPKKHVFEMLNRNGKACDNGGQIHAFPPVELRSWDGNCHDLQIQMTNDE
jgi:hypothetical protein